LFYLGLGTWRQNGVEQSPQGVDTLNEQELTVMSVMALSAVWGGQAYTVMSSPTPLMSVQQVGNT